MPRSTDKCAHFSQPYHASAAAAAEPAFPPELLASPPTPLRVSPDGEGGPTWWRPASLSELLELRHAYPEARFVAGNSEIGIESRYKSHPAVSFVAAGAVAELRECRDSPETMLFGACAPLSHVERLCKRAAATRPGHAGETARAIELNL